MVKGMEPTLPLRSKLLPTPIVSRHFPLTNPLQKPLVLENLAVEAFQAWTTLVGVHPLRSANEHGQQVVVIQLEEPWGE